MKTILAFRRIVLFLSPGQTVLQPAERQAQVLGISCDHIAAHRAWSTSMGGLPYPELSDWHPKGKVTQAYDLWNEERGVSFRAVIVVDKAGIVRFRQRYAPGTLPDPEAILKVVAG